MALKKRAAVFSRSELSQSITNDIQDSRSPRVSIVNDRRNDLIVEVHRVRWLDEWS